MRQSMGAVVFSMALASACAGSDQPTILERAPEAPDPQARYLFYLHGRIIEIQGPEAVSRNFGRYEFHGILQAFAERGFVVVAEVRKGNAGEAFVEATAAQVKKLLEAGVPPAHITVVGFSKGGSLTLGVAARGARDDVSYAILAGCFGDADWAKELGPRLRGSFLSLYDRDDRLSPSCEALFAHAAHVQDTSEHVFESGLDHGHFYTPRADWMDRVATWSKEERD